MRTNWKKWITNAGWLSLTVAGIALLVAAVNKKDLKRCTDIKVELNGIASHVFMDEKEILSVLNSNGDLTGQPVEGVNLQMLERRLEKDKWIKNAELFFDNNQVLQVRVEERIPIARVFTIAGSSFYIDSVGKQLPLSDVSIRVPMFTSFPAIGNKLAKSDIDLLTSIRDIAIYINTDDFWKAQVSQIDITPQRTFEMIPTIGNHVVKLGKGTDIEDKLNKLYTFYKQVWTKVGLEKYASIDVQFKGQVIATRKGTWTTNIDSAEVKKALDSLKANNTPDTIYTSTITRLPVIKQNKVGSNNISNGVQKVVLESAQNRHPANKTGTKNKIMPKAVMQKKD